MCIRDRTIFLRSLVTNTSIACACTGFKNHEKSCTDMVQDSTLRRFLIILVIVYLLPVGFLFIFIHRGGCAARTGSMRVQFTDCTIPQSNIFWGVICIETIHIQFTEAWYSPKSKQLVFFFSAKNPQTVLHYGFLLVVNAVRVTSHS